MIPRRTSLPVGAAALAALLSPAAAGGEPAEVLAFQKISETAGGFTGALSTPDLFGISVTRLGDLDGDGADDVMVGAYLDGEAAPGAGAAYVLFLNEDGTVRSHRKITTGQSGFEPELEAFDMFGWSGANLGDLDGDGTVDVALGSWLDDDGPLGDHGAIFVLFLEPDGRVKAHQKISATDGGFTGTLYPGNRFGTSLVSPGDLDGDGVNDLVAGAIYDQESYYLAGSLYVLFLNPDGTVRSHVKITDGMGGFGGKLAPHVRFGYSVCTLGDLDLDGVPDLATGSILDDGGGVERGAVWILFMNADGTVKAERKISDQDAGFQGAVDDQDYLGHSVAAIPDLNGDGVVELAVGAIADDDGGESRGAVWVLFLDRDGTVKGHRKISDTAGGFTGGLKDGDRFGQSACFLGDLDGDGAVELAVGADHDDDGGADQGAVWILSLDRSAWTHLGHGLAGAAGAPEMFAEGTLKGGDPVTVTVIEAPPHAAVWFVAGAAELSAPMLGGTLVPDPSAPGFSLLYATDAAGALVLNATFPAGVPPGTKLWLQAWVADATAPFGASATNALRGVTP